MVNPTVNPVPVQQNPPVTNVNSGTQSNPSAVDFSSLGSLE